MKMAKQFRRYAARAEKIASRTADSFVAEQTRSLALAFRAQAEVMKKNKKKKNKKNSALRRTNADLVEPADGRSRRAKGRDIVATAP
jgi:hypothetical protein